MNLVLGNVDYRLHTTDEGDQLQRGLEAAGWLLCGAGFGDGCADVPELLERHAPAAVMVHDKRDWDPASPISFRKDIGFSNLRVLARRPEILRAGVLKDAGSALEYHRRFFAEIQADAAVVYYHPQIVKRLNPWLGQRKLVRIFHSVDRYVCEPLLDEDLPRQRAVITGASSPVYPLRHRLMRYALDHPEAHLSVFGHPGYGNGGAYTNAYLRLLAGFRVHIATASRYGFALRKIIESVAVGCTPVTNLPPEDVLPEIDGALVRIPLTASSSQALAAAELAAEAWSFEERRAWAEKAWSFYDWRASGLRLAAALEGRARAAAPALEEAL